LGSDVDPPIEPDRFRLVLGHLPTGVTVVTAHHPGGPVAMSANSVTSVSLQPPLILFCPAKSSTSWPLIRESGRFCGVAWHARASGPALDDAVAWIECTIDAVHEGGDHLIVVGAVDRLDVREGEADPLVFFRGRYGSFAAND
jgi:3-hydroxy-9,10-secoandrosta-1,3,5(10)-triene-9,17-dione monooxygenase reductase component